MKRVTTKVRDFLNHILNRLGLGMRAKLIIIFLLVKVLPLILVTIIAWQQFTLLGDVLREIAVEDSSAALNDSAIENIERMTTDTAQRVADFLYARDDDVLYLANLEPTEENYRLFSEGRRGRLIQTGEWVLAEDGQSWVPTEEKEPIEGTGGGISTNNENNDMDGFHYRDPEQFTYKEVSLYDEITFVDLEGNEIVKYVSPDSTKKNHPMSAEKTNVSEKANTFVRAEMYYEALQDMGQGDIYVSDVIGAYVGANYIGMYTPDIVAAAAEQRGYDIDYDPEKQAYSGEENPNGERFEGIVRWATPVADESGAIVGYVTMALNHDHIMEFVDHQTPMNERYKEVPSAYEGNYAFIWDYQCRSICHPRHHSIVGYDPETGDEQIPWLESSIYEAWQASGVEKWTDFIVGWPEFDEQSRKKSPALELTKAGFVGLDGRYLNNAPQCIGWMDLTKDGGSGSFYILWSGIYKPNTAAAIPYYTGQYAPSEKNGYSRRGFGFVAVGAGLEDFQRPAKEMEVKLTEAVEESLIDTSLKFIIVTTIIVIVVVLIAIWLASWITGNITKLIKGISRFRSGERQFRFNSKVNDEFGELADSFDDMANSVVSSVTNPLSIIDMDRKIIYMNDAGLTFTGMTLDAIVGTSYSDSSVYPAGSKYDPIAAMEDKHEAEIYYFESTDRYIRGVANYFYNKDNRRIGYIIETTDMTDMVREQMKIEEQRLLLDKVFSASPDLIWYMDAKGIYLTVNPRFAAIAGKEPDLFIGKTAEDILPSYVAADFAKNDMETIRSSQPFYSEERITFADGHEEVLDSVRTPIYDGSGTLVGLLGFARNVDARVQIESELRSTQIELEKAVADANRANEHKGEFLARMSHEIRTPMNAIIGITNIVQKKLDDMGDERGELNEVHGHVNQIEASSQHLLGLLNDILDISKIEAGKIELTEEKVELNKLATTVAGIIQPRCDEKNIQFIAQFGAFDRDTFLSDSLRLRQVLINLLGNAVKFTPECGRIEFLMEKIEERGDEILVGFTVRDNGIGIAEDSQESIFQAFEQGGGKVTRQYGGTGLGLAISQRIVQLLGGEIKLKSKLNEGSEFYFELWMKKTEADAPVEIEMGDIDGIFEGKRALLVDDVEINRMIVASMLEMTGAQIDEADDGVSCVKMFEESEPYTYDIILMDVQMPNMDGYEASRVIRDMDRPDAKTVPIVALTANAFKEDMDKALKNGMNAHIAKPVEMDTLIETLARFLRGTK